jgi:hypothetical protein
MVWSLWSLDAEPSELVSRLTLRPFASSVSFLVDVFGRARLLFLGIQAHRNNVYNEAYLYGDVGPGSIFGRNTYAYLACSALL